MSPSANCIYSGQVNANLICCICRSPFDNPYTATTCSHTFCFSCISQALQQTRQCPVDRSSLGMDDMKPSPAIVRNLVDELMVHCRNTHCDAIVQRDMVQHHEKAQCAYSLVICSAAECGVEVLRKDLEGHMDSRCGAKIDVCDKCGENVKQRDQTAHLVGCATFEDECSACHTAVRRSELAKHIGVCHRAMIHCPSAQHGCPATTPRAGMPDHTVSCPFQALSSFFAINDAKFAASARDHEQLVAKVQSLEGEVRIARCEADETKRSLGCFFSRRDGQGQATAVEEMQALGDLDLASTEPIAPHSIRWPQDGAQPESIPDPGFTPYLAFAPPGVFAMAPARLAPLNTWPNMSMAEAVTALRNVVQGLAHAMDGLERRAELRTTTESLRLLEEVGSLRAIVHGLRMQVMMDRTQLLQRTLYPPAHVPDPSTSTVFSDLQTSGDISPQDTHVPFEFASQRQVVADAAALARVEERNEVYSGSGHRQSSGTFSSVNVSRRAFRRESATGPKL